MSSKCRPAGLYVHVPFCKKKCNYCDFCSVGAPTDEMMTRYADRLREELHRKAILARGVRFDTVYVGGGTPTILPPSLLAGVLREIKTDYCVNPDAEITLECNPATTNETALSVLRRAGFNRISIGAQSFVEEELAALGRVHGVAAIDETVASAYRAGFTNVSLDLMYGIPHQTTASLAYSLERAVALGVEHLSVYSLIVEEGTPFYDCRDRLPLPEEDTLCEMTDLLLQITATAGYTRYEISNFSKKGYMSRHNLHYWNMDDYLGFGPAAHSLWRGVRTGHSVDIGAYVSGVDTEEPEEILTDAAARDEYVMLRFRLTDGIEKAVFQERYGTSFDALYAARLTPYVQAGLVVDTPERVALTSRGLDVSNTILADLL